MEVQRTHVIFVFRPIYGRQLGIEILHEINGVDAMCNRMNDCKQINRKIHRNRMDVTFSAHRKLRLASPQDIDGCSLASPSSTPSAERKSCSILCGRLYWMSCTPEESSGRWWRLWLEPWHVLCKTLAVWKASTKKKFLRTKTLKISCWQILCVFPQKMSRPDLPQATSAGNSSSHLCSRRDTLCRRRKNWQSATPSMRGREKISRSLITPA